MALKVPVGSHDHVLGPGDAPVTLVEYGDYQCPYCGMAQPVVQEVRRRFGDRLRFVFRHFPLTESHPNAGPAAETAEFAGAHGRFWLMHEALYAHQQDLRAPVLYDLRGGHVACGVARRPGHARVRAADRGRRPGRGAQRGDRHAGLLHQRRAPRRRIRPAGTVGRDPGGGAAEMR